MLIVDRREKDLIGRMKDVVVTELEYGDIQILGNGPDGGMSVGMERKKVRDLITSITSGRLSGHQIPGMTASYDVVYLLIEGEWRREESGAIKVKMGNSWKRAHFGKRVVKWEDVWTWLTTMEIMTGCKVKCVSGIEETVRMLAVMDRWASKEWNRHKGHEMKRKNPAWLVPGKKPSLVRRVAEELPGIGQDRAKEVEKVFGCVKTMVNADIKEWLAIPGIGKATAKIVTESVNKEE